MKRMMTNALAIATAASWVMVAGAQSSTSQGSSTSSRSDAKSMKFTGCLQQGDTPNSYKLTNVQAADTSRSGSTSGTSGSGSTGSGSGTTGSGSTSGSGMSGEWATINELELTPSGSSIDFSEHVGKRVEITAKAAKSDSMSGTSGSSSGTSGSGTTGSGSTSGSGSTASGQHSGHDMNKKKVQVTAVRALGGSCSGN